MASTPNIFNNFLALNDVVQDNDMYERRMINDSTGNILYLAITTIPNAATNARVFLVRKFLYDGNGFVNRVQLPDNGIGFTYSFDDITTYFS